MPPPVCLLLAVMPALGGSYNRSFEDEHETKFLANQKLELNTAFSNKVTLEACPTSLPVTSPGTITDCTFTGKTSKVVNLASGLVTIVNCTFQSCSSSGHGGCIYLSGSATGHVEGCSMISISSSGEGGGAIYTGTGTNFTLKGCYASLCSCSRCGGTVYILESTVVIEECHIGDSFAVWVGGAIHVYDSSTAYLTTVKDSRITNCSSANVDVGQPYATGAGAITCAKGEAILQRLTIRSCSAGGYGGAIACEPSNGGNVTIEDCVIEKCSCTINGAAISFERGSSCLRIANLTCKDCVGSGAIYVVAARDFQWEHLCILNCTSPAVISSINLPSDTEILSGCVFTELFDFACMYRTPIYQRIVSYGVWLCYYIAE